MTHWDWLSFFAGVVVGGPIAIATYLFLALVLPYLIDGGH